MAIQIDCEELLDCPGYLKWMSDKIRGLGTGKDAGEPKPERVTLGTVKLGTVKLGNWSAQWEPYVRLLHFLYGADFYVVDGMEEDTIRATDAMGLRRRYADETGAFLSKSERDIDRIWKSVHGKCSVLEFLLQLCIRLDTMVNEDEPEAMVNQFFGILLGNLDIREEDTDADLVKKITRFLDRKYNADGSEGGLFPLKNWSEKTHQDQRKVSIWYQMNTWLAEHLDDEEHFLE